MNNLYTDEDLTASVTCTHYMREFIAHELSASSRPSGVVDWRPTFMNRHMIHKYREMRSRYMTINMTTHCLHNPDDLEYRIKKAIQSINGLFVRITTIKRCECDINSCVDIVEVDHLDEDLVSVSVRYQHSIIGGLVFKYNPIMNRWEIISTQEYIRLFYNIKDFYGCYSTLDNPILEDALVRISADAHCRAE